MSILVSYLYIISCIGYSVELSLLQVTLYYALYTILFKKKYTLEQTRSHSKLNGLGFNLDGELTHTAESGEVHVG